MASRRRLFHGGEVLGGCAVKQGTSEHTEHYEMNRQFAHWVKGADRGSA